MPPDQQGTDFDPNRFVGRVQELAKAHKVVKPNSNPALLHVLGDTGMGKTWFLEKIYKRLDRQEPLSTNAAPLPSISIKIDFNYDATASEEIYSVKLVSFVRRIRNDFILVDPDLAPGFVALTNTINQFSNRQTNGPWNKEFMLNLIKANNDRSLKEFVELEFGGDVIHQIDWEKLNQQPKKVYDYFFKINRLDLLSEKLLSAYPNIRWDLGNQLDGTETYQRKIAKAKIAQALFDALTEVAKTHQHVLIIFDAFEKAPNEIKSWLTLFFFPLLLENKNTITTISVLIAEQFNGTGRFTELRSVVDILEIFPIPKLKDEEVKDYFLEKRADLTVSKEEVIEMLEKAKSSSGDDVRIPSIMSSKADSMTGDSQFDIFQQIRDSMST